MRALDELLEEHSDTISKNWFTRLNRSAANPHSPELRDALPDILRELNVALRHTRAKSGALAPAVYPPHRLGFDLEIVFAEYALLRDCVLEVLAEQGAVLQIDEVRALTDVFSRAVARAVSQHAEQARNRDLDRSKAARVEMEAAHARALAQEQAARSEAQIEREAQHRLFMQAPVAIAILEGPEHRFIFANPAYRALVNDRDVVGKPLVEALPELADDGFDDLLEEVIAGGKALFRKEVELQLNRQGASEAVFANFTYTPKRDSRGRIDGVLVSASEVTEQVRARRDAVRLNAQLGESELLLRNLVDNLPDLAWSATANGSVDFYNQRWFEYTGTALEEVRGWNWQQAHDPAWLPKVIETWQHSLATGEPFEMEFPLRAADGTFQWFLTRVHPLRDRSGKIVRWIGTNTNIHRQRETSRRAEEASRAKDEFLATASHELRTPLNAILGWARILRSGQVDPSAYARGLETIERNAKAQVQLIEDILDGSRIITGKLHLEIRPLDLTALVRAALDAVRPAADAKNIELRVELDPAAARVVGDPERLQQVVWNLANNAVKFTAKGGLVTVSLRRVGTAIELTVSDNGQGITADFLPFVFDRFCQAEGSTTRRYGGLGLGLALVRNLVEAHGGTVRAESAGEGRGATFVVQLPVQAVYEEPADPERPSQPQASAVLTGRDGLTGVKVLLVDDELDARELVATVLRASGAEVTTAASAAQAIEHLVSDMPTVLVSDIGMPEVDGYELIRRIRSSTGVRGAELPAVALTAYAREQDRRRALEAGFQTHVSKPVEPAELVRVVSHLVHFITRQSSPGDRGAALERADAFLKFERILTQQGIHEALRFLNSRTSHRFTGLYRFEPPTLRNLMLVDSYAPESLQGERAPLLNTYCSIVSADERSFTTEDSRHDDRLRSHPARDRVLSYCGVLLRDSEGRPFGTLCHFDLVPSDIPVSEMPLIEATAPLLVRAIQRAKLE